MKIIRRDLEKDQSGTITLSPMDEEDMWYVYNLVQEGDEIAAKTTRKIALLKKDGTPTGDSVRKQMRLRVKVQKIEFDVEGSILRLNGPVVEDAPDVSSGTFHTIQLELKQKFDLHKELWDTFSLEQIEEAANVENRSEIAGIVLQPGLAHICLVTDTMTVLRLKVEQNIPRKRRADSSAHDKALAKFLVNVSEGMKRNINLEKVKVVLLAGPGNLPTDLYNEIIQSAFAEENQEIFRAKSKFLKVRASSGHMHALDEALADPSVQTQLQNTRYGRETAAMDRFFKALNNDDDTAWYGPKQVEAAVEQGSVQTLMITDTLFRSSDVSERRQYVELVESVRSAGREALIFSSQHSSGEQLDEMTGVACITFFPTPDLHDIE